MKLSEAIRLGTTICPPVYGPVFKRDAEGNVCGACRAGATALAGGYKPSRHPSAYDWLDVQLFLELVWGRMNRDYFVGGIANALALMHERYGWSAEMCAQNVERFEQKDEYFSQPAVTETAQPTEEVPCQMSMK